MATAEIKRHWDRVAQLRCVITRAPNPTLHHCKSGSMTAISGLKSANQKPSDWLVIPLDFEFHNGRFGIDSGMGVKTWETRYGSQADHLDWVSRQLGYNVWYRAGIDRQVPGLHN